MKIHLPHGCSIDDKENVIVLDLGSVQLKFSFEEWEDFVSVISDIDSVIQTNLSVESFTCPSCGSLNGSYEYRQPSDDEYN